MSPDKEQRPGRATGAPGEDSGSKSLGIKVTRRADSQRLTRRCIHSKPVGRFCSPCVYRRRDLQRRADLFVGRRTAGPVEPSSFGLDDEDLRAEANRLVADGWTIGEITEVLAVTPR